MPVPYIRFENIDVRYTPEVYGLRGATLGIERGGFVFFIGKTGAGKSTLIKLLTREVSASGGRVMLDGKNLEDLPNKKIPALRRQMGIVPQDFALLPRKNVFENVAYAMRAAGHSLSETRRKVPVILEQVGLDKRAKAFPHELSGGEQQRVAIARALVNSPSLVVADEPTGNLDPEVSMEIMDLLRRLNDQGTTVLVASHDMTVIHQLGKRVVTIDAGRIVSDTLLAPPPEELMDA